MTLEEKLTAIVAALDEAGLQYLVMGGHAVRHYGVQRNTNDFDFHVSLDEANWKTLPDRLTQTSFFSSGSLIEGPSWRADDFRRFQIGQLPDGREEWLEFWRRNHLLPLFEDLYARREQEEYNHRQISFISLPDLIRSKETERESDWMDIAILEEILDARHLANTEEPEKLISALANLRSRRGYENTINNGYLEDQDTVEQALNSARHPISLAYLIPHMPSVDLQLDIDDVVQGALRKTDSGSPRHHALVEVVRRSYKQASMAADRADKESILNKGS
ncbi:MAG: hypothetical protein O2857_16225 [Planctomycetota bacterium]|nr:hypothetical protein [Planctomycetota bacterium]